MRRGFFSTLPGVTRDMPEFGRRSIVGCRAGIGALLASSRSTQEIHEQAGSTAIDEPVSTSVEIVLLLRDHLVRRVRRCRSGESGRRPTVSTPRAGNWNVVCP